MATTTGKLVDAFREILSAQAEGPGPHYSQPRKIRVSVWDEDSSGGETVADLDLKRNDVKKIIKALEAI